MKLLKIFGLGMAVGQRVPIRVPNNIDLELLQSEAISSLQGSMAGKTVYFWKLIQSYNFLIKQIFWICCKKFPNQRFLREKLFCSQVKISILLNKTSYNCEPNPSQFWWIAICKFLWNLYQLTSKFDVQMLTSITHIHVTVSIQRIIFISFY